MWCWNVFEKQQVDDKRKMVHNTFYRPIAEKLMPAQNGQSCINLLSTNSMTITEKLNKPFSTHGYPTNETVAHSAPPLQV